MRPAFFITPAKKLTTRCTKITNQEGVKEYLQHVCLVSFVNFVVQKQPLPNRITNN